MGMLSLPELIAAHKRGMPVGIYSLCSAHPFVLEAGVQQALEDEVPLLIESTANQVNQQGGYTSMTPADFRRYVERIADRLGFPHEQLILGGDHLGPYPWQQESAAVALMKARILVRDCVLAGYTKIHLDASMRCADDPAGPLLDKATASERAAVLCQAAEEAACSLESGRQRPLYVIGTEVPTPGGVLSPKAAPAVTTVEDVRETLELTRGAFLRRGLEEAWERVIAVVVQPGVEFGDDSLFPYDRRAAAPLAQFIENEKRLVFEAHSTDYQTRDALRALVEDHFAILKVGPAATFAFREAVFSLAMMEAEWLSRRRGVALSNIRRVLDNVMVDVTAYWERYYIGPEPRVQFARSYSFSDRLRYYWPDAEIQQALARLIANLERYPVPLTLLSQFLPVQYERVRMGRLDAAPRALIYDKIRSVLADYVYACRGERHTEEEWGAKKLAAPVSGAALRSYSHSLQE